MTIKQNTGTLSFKNRAGFCTFRQRSGTLNFRVGEPSVEIFIHSLDFSDSRNSGYYLLRYT